MRDAFTPDGALRDILVRDTTIEDWDRLLNATESWGWHHEWLIDGERGPRPASAAAAFASSDSHTLALVVDGLRLHLHFFSPDEVEADLDPRDVRDERDYDTVCDVMRRFGRLLDRHVLLADEGGDPRHVLLSYDPANDAFLVESSDAGAERAKRHWQSPWDGYSRAKLRGFCAVLFVAMTLAFLVRDHRLGGVLAGLGLTIVTMHVSFLLVAALLDWRRQPARQAMAIVAVVASSAITSKLLSLAF